MKKNSGTSYQKKMSGSRHALKKIKSIGKIARKIRTAKVFYISRLKLGRFRPKFKMFIKRGNFIIKTVENVKELENVLRLRFDVFFQELLDKKAMIAADIDEFDFICDHLVIIDSKTNKYVGTYRLNLSDVSKRFYSSQEFNINNILKLPGTKLELGRACVDRRYRTGIIISLLWRGIAEYIKLTNARYLFGCSSVKIKNLEEAALLYIYLMRYHRAPDEFMVEPTRNFKMASMKEYVDSIKLDNNTLVAAKSLIPPLMNFYLSAGAFVCGEPAFDRIFKCVDFFTVLDMKNIKKSIEKKYNI